MNQDQLDRIENKLDKIIEIFSAKSPVEVRRKAQADVLHYLTKHGINVKGQHGGEIKKQR